MTPRRLCLLYEHGHPPHPFGSSFIRLLLPLQHPSLEGSLAVAPALDYEGQDVDAVIVDRLWRPDLSAALVQTLAAKVRAAGARLIYALDDDFLDLPTERLDRLATTGVRSAAEILRLVEYLIQTADGVMVTTVALKERLSSLNRNIAVVSHALDERLLIARAIPDGRSPFGPRPLVIGCMGTYTHDLDLMTVLPALRTVCERHPSEVEFEILGVIGRDETWQALSGLPVHGVSLGPEERFYPRFMLRFTGRTRWDLAIAPLSDSPFNRCKSDIKFLDYAAVGAAGIYSRCPAYESSVDHTKTGLLVDNSIDAWAEALELLVSDDDLRVSIAHNASKYLFGERILAVSANRWLAALETLLEGASDRPAQPETSCLVVQ